MNKRGPKLGKIFVKKFFIVGIAPKNMPTCFAICGDHGNPTSTSDEDGLYPCIGTDRRKAEAQFEKAREAYEQLEEAGNVVLIEFTGGIITKIHECTNDQIKAE